MNETRSYVSPLRERQAEETRRHIVQTALEMIQKKPDDVVTHEQVAKHTSIGVRTVYRYFPSHTDLLDAVWRESDHRLALTHYPNTEEQLLGSIEDVFARMDNNADLMRALLRSNAGQEMRKRDNERRRVAVFKALENATRHLSSDDRRRATAVFQVLYSARAWEMLRDRAKLNEGEPAQAIAWAFKTLLNALYREQKQLKAHPAPTTDITQSKQKSSKA